MQSRSEKVGEIKLYPLSDRVTIRFNRDVCAMDVKVDCHCGDATYFNQSKKVIPFVSFIIPALNEEVRLKRTIDAISSLEYPKESLEIIVVDNSSSDNTSQIAKQCGATVVNASPRNRAVARNAGVRVSRGEILCFIDADCILHSDWLRKIVDVFQSTTAHAVQSLILPTKYPHKESAKNFPLYHLGRPFVDTKACAIYRKVFDAVGGFDERLVRCEDIDLSWRMNQHGFSIEFPDGVVAYGGIPEDLRTVVRRSLETARGLTALYEKWQIRKSTTTGYVKIAARLFKIRSHNQSIHDWMLWILGDLTTFLLQKGSYFPELFAPPINFSISFFSRVAKEVLILRASLLRLMRPRSWG